jgi:aldehyde:ferredoxin oxidoreductase
MLKFLRVKTDTKSILYEDVKEEYAMYGGRGLIAKILNDEVNPKCDELGPENKFIACGGLLNGTTLSCSGRLSVGGKSPLTGGIKEANAGGTAGQMLAKLGIKAIIIENKPLNNEWYILKIDKNKADLLPADKYVGMNTYALSAQLRSDFGEKVGMILIGTAGERGSGWLPYRLPIWKAAPAVQQHAGGLEQLWAQKGSKL